ncbi:MAG: hypothetical protein NTU53_10495 [Planctomycetota bacterium]|nr:hypothetical protein [Planctomycetota bacterium]
MSRLDSHVAAVQRKLSLVTFVEWLAMTGFVLAVLVLLTILLQRATHVGLPPMAIWVGLGLAMLVAGIMATINRPTREAAAVAIDEKLLLKEKFSTALQVRNWDDPFAKAVVLDAEATAAKVHLQGQFPVRFPRMGYWTVGAAFVALCATLVPPMDLLGKEQKEITRRAEERKIAQTKDDIQKLIAKVEALPVALRTNEEIKTSKEHLEKLVAHPMPDPEKAARRRMELMSKIDEAMKKQVEASKSFAQSQKAASMFRSMSLPIDGKGPVADAQRKIVEGKFKEAIEDLKKLNNDFKDMKPEDKQKAVEQMNVLAQKLAAMAQDQKAMEKVAVQLQQAQVKPEQIKQAQELIQKAAMGDPQAQKQLQQMQQQIQKQMQQQGANQQQQQAMQQAMQKAMQQANAQAQAGQMAQAAQAMAQAMQQMQAGGKNAGQQMQGAQGQMADVMGQLEAMQQDAQAMAAAQQALQDAMAQAGGQLGGAQGRIGGEGVGQWQPGEINRPGGAAGGPGIGQHGGPGKSAAPFGTKTEMSPSQYNPKGEHLASMMVKDRSVRGESKAELQKIAEAAEAEEGEDVDNSAVDRRSQQVKRNYFNVMARDAKQ